MLDHIFDAVDWMADWLDQHTSWGWHVRLFIWEHNHAVTHQQCRAKFIQDGCMAMAEEQWYEWFETLSTREFLHIMLLGDPEYDEIDDMAKEIADEIKEFANANT
jgi:hypothetical protein